ncbi:DUF3558 domain-containing protein [Streptomyces tropicalis]|uniref:DUF3558 domain-containing protein n=1 Tax=Streptomyces tropicalis TaxID=3034234 RepID=A0ABT6ABM9_9ACTN|nr:DUF3558 domain-containing protein [Streptomyces tropicalis]MDF3301852.1 DUF3558 domain-containing protein [Streptomyces tropicalis]
MSEGTMQRADQRDQRDPRVKRPNRALVVAAAVPVMFLAAACSSGSGSSADAKETPAGDSKSATSASASPTVQPAAYRKLPEACRVLSGRTLEEMVPKGTKSAKEGTSSDVSRRAGCSWSSLDNNGVKGSQFRWLNVSLLRFDSDASRGSGDKQAQGYYQRQVQDARSVEGARNTKSAPLAGTGDEATSVRYDLKKKEGSFKQETVVTRVQNVVVTVDYNGAGLAGDQAPDAGGLAKAAQTAAKEAVAAVASANGGGSSSGGTSASKPASPSASKGAGSGKASPSASAGAAKSASPSASKN